VVMADGIANCQGQASARDGSCYADRLLAIHQQPRPAPTRTPGPSFAPLRLGKPARRRVVVYFQRLSPRVKRPASAGPFTRGVEQERVETAEEPTVRTGRCPAPGTPWMSWRDTIGSVGVVWRPRACPDGPPGPAAAGRG